MNREREEIRTPEEAYEEAAIELAVYRLMKQECGDVGTSDGKEAADVSLAAEDSVPRVLEKIDRSMRLVQRRTHWRAGALRVMKTAAALVLIANLGLTITFSADARVRETVMGFFVRTNGPFIEFGLRTVDSNPLMPEDWPESYFPTYIPEGYVATDYLPQEGCSEIIYRDADKHILDVRVSGPDVSAMYIIEGAELSTIPFLDTTATVLRHPEPFDLMEIIWAWGDRYFVVGSTESYETALAVAESMSVIRKSQ